MTIFHWLAVMIVTAFLGAGGGWLARGDCAKEVRATEAVATAHAEVTAETIVSNVRLADVTVKQNFDQIIFGIETLPPPAPAPAGCPARALDAGELRLWNASNQGRYVPVQQAGTDAPRSGDTGHDGGREGGGEEPRRGDAGLPLAGEPARGAGEVRGGQQP